MQRFHIVIEGFGPHANDPARGLMKVFGIDAATAQTIVQRAPIVVKHDVTVEAAEPYERALLAIGALVRLRPVESAPLAPTTSTLNDAPRRVRAQGQVETALMHGSGWEPQMSLQPPAPSHSLRAPARVSAPPPRVSAPPPRVSAPPSGPSSAPPALGSLGVPPVPSFADPRAPQAPSALLNTRSDRPPPAEAPGARLVVAPGAQLFEAPPATAALEFADDVTLPEQGFRPISSRPPPAGVDPTARTTRFAASLELPWVGDAPEPPRKPSPSQRPPRDR